MLNVFNREQTGIEPRKSHHCCVLVPVAGVKGDETAIVLACELAGSSGKGLVIAVHVIQVERCLPLDAEKGVEIGRAEDFLSGIEARIKKLGCEAETEILQAREIAPAIIGMAEERGADLILLGISRKSHFGEFHFGEVAPYIFQHAHCRVLMQHSPEEEPHPV
jgi:nucleotide-binding universal stress UspA family protein